MARKKKLWVSGGTEKSILYTEEHVLGMKITGECDELKGL